jgi:hypothetical protein
VEFRDLAQLAILHIIGLRIDPAYKPLAEGLRNIRSGRGARAADG